MSNVIGLIIESLVAALLATTIFYCITLNRRLTRLKSDEQMLKATISELITATEMAERAIAGLKLTVHDCDQTLGTKLQQADDLGRVLSASLADGDRMMLKLARIVSAGRAPAKAPTAAEMREVAAAASVIASRAREAAPAHNLAA